MTGGVWRNGGEEIENGLANIKGCQTVRKAWTTNSNLTSSSSSPDSSSLTLWTMNPISSSVSSPLVVAIPFSPSNAWGDVERAVRPTVSTPNTSSLYGSKGISSSTGSVSVSSICMESRAALIISESKRRVGALFQTSSGFKNSRTKCGAAWAKVYLATEADEDKLC